MTPGSEVTQNSLDLLDECLWENIETGFQSNHVFKYLSFHVGVFEVFWVSCFWSNLFGHEKPVLPFKTTPWVDKITNLASCPVSVWKCVWGADVRTEPCSLMQAFGQSHSTPVLTCFVKQKWTLQALAGKGLWCFRSHTEDWAWLAAHATVEDYRIVLPVHNISLRPVWIEDSLWLRGKAQQVSAIESRGSRKRRPSVSYKQTWWDTKGNKTSQDIKNLYITHSYWFLQKSYIWKHFHGTTKVFLCHQVLPSTNFMRHRFIHLPIWKCNL